MLVSDCMTRHPIMISPETKAPEAQKIMSENKVRHLPVVGDGKRLIGLITRQRLSLKPDFLGSLNVWEITRYLADLDAEKLMIKRENVHTTTADRTIERAAKTMSQYRIGCLPVIDEGEVVVGIISEVDLLGAFQQMLGLPVEGVRVTMRMPNKKGEFSKLTTVIAENGWGILGIGSFPAPKAEGYYDMVLKIEGVHQEEVKNKLSSIPDQEVVDIREIV